MPQVPRIVTGMKNRDESVTMDEINQFQVVKSMYIFTYVLTVTEKLLSVQ